MKYLALAAVSVAVAVQAILAQNVTPKQTSVQEVVLRYDQRRFTPQKVETHRDEPVDVRVVNASKERIEFESFKLHRELVIEAGETVVIHFPALRPGSYDFFDDFHSDVPEGAIVVK